MTLPTLPQAIFSTFARHPKPRHKANLAKELKMPTHRQRTQADGFLFSFTLNKSNTTSSNLISVSQPKAKSKECYLPTLLFLRTVQQTSVQLLLLLYNSPKGINQLELPTK